MFLAIHLLLILSLASAAYEDHKTTYVSLWKLVIALVLSLGFVIYQQPFGGIAFEHAVGGFIGLILGLLLNQVLGKLFGREAFGMADVLLLIIGGTVLGMQWVGPWLISVFALGIGCFMLGQSRKDIEKDDGHLILPLIPILSLTLIILMMGRYFQFLPPRAF